MNNNELDIFHTDNTSNYDIYGVESSDPFTDAINGQKSVINPSKIEGGERTIYDLMLKEYEDDFIAGKAAVLKFIYNYIKDQIVNMSSRGPSRRVMFTKTNENEFFKLFNADQAKVKSFLKQSKILKPNWEIANNPLNCLCVTLVSYYYNTMTQEEVKLSKDEAKKLNLPCYVVCLFFAIRFYSSLQYKYFQYGADEEIMNEVVDEMSNRYTMTKRNFNTIYELINYISYTAIDNKPEALTNPIDFYLNYFTSNLNTRLNDIIKSMANAFYEKTDANRKVVIESTTVTNEEGKTSLAVTTSISNDIESITRKLLIALSSETEADAVSLQIACNQTRQSFAKMGVVINKIVENDLELVGNMTRHILAYYLGSLGKPKNTIKSSNFLTIMKKSYTISNTNDEFVLKIKVILDTLLEHSYTDYIKINRSATVSNLRSCIFYYFICYINRKSEL